MKVSTLINAKSNVSPWYVHCCTSIRRSKTKILTTRAPPSWIKFDVVTSHRQTRHLEYGLWLLISMFLRLLISCKSQKNRLRALSNRFKQHYTVGDTTVGSTLWRHNVKLNPRWRRPSRQYFGFRYLRVQLQHCTYQRKTLIFVLIKVNTFICKREISGFSSPLKLLQIMNY